MKADFDSFAAEYAFWQWTISPQSYGEVMRFLPRQANRAIDVGCGAGPLVLRLSEHFRYVVGIDLSSSLIAIAKKYQAERKRYNADFIVGTLASLPFAEGAFDFVSCGGVLHNVPVAHALLCLRDLVKPGGRMVILDYPSRGRRGSAYSVRHAFRVLLTVPNLVRSFGLRRAWRIVRFQTSREWLSILGQGLLLTFEQFQEACRRALPGCTFERHPWAMIAFWQAPD